MDNDNGPGNDNNSGVVQPVFPADYADSFTELRGCEVTQGHGAAYTQIWGNDPAVEPYLAQSDVLPEGAILIKEEYKAPGCNAEDLTGWSTLRKEAPGFDPEDGDWHWQLVSKAVGVLFDDKATCIGCHSAPYCLARDYTCGVRE